MSLYYKMMFDVTLLTLFGSSSKCRIFFKFWHFPTIFVLLKLTCLVTLFDRKLQVVNVARFARNVE